MKKYSQSSIWDNLIRIMPELGLQIKKAPEAVDPLAANSLYSIWRSGETKKDSKLYKKPVTLSKDDVDRMKEAGLVKVVEDNIQITAKGEKVIRVMILGDDRSIFEDNGVVIDYNKALSNTKGVKTAKKRKS